MIGTICFNLVDGGNRPMLKKYISQMSDKGWGAWCLVAVCDGMPNVSELKKPHEAKEK